VCVCVWVGGWVGVQSAIQLFALPACCTPPPPPPPPPPGDQWRINFSRVHYNVTWSEDQQRYVKQPPDQPGYNWVWSPQWQVAMHQPETWGYVQFEDTPGERGAWVRGCADRPAGAAPTNQPWLFAEPAAHQCVCCAARSDTSRCCCRHSVPGPHMASARAAGGRVPRTDAVLAGACWAPARRGSVAQGMLGARM
jgi:hypothetical protein